MDIINRLIELEVSIKKVYLKLIEYEIANNTLEYQSMKSVVTRLIANENEIFMQITNDNSLLLKLHDFLFKNLYQNYDIYDEIFLSSLKGNYEPLVLLRIYNRYNNYLLYLTRNQISELADEKILEDLDISVSNFDEISILNWNIGNVIENTSSKLEFLFLNQKTDDNNYYSNNDYASLIRYKNLLVYVYPILEKYFIFGNEPSLSIPSIFSEYKKCSCDYQKVFLLNMQQSIEKNIYYLVNTMITDIDYSDYLCSEEILNTIYLIGIQANLCLLEEQEFKNIKDKIIRILDHNFVFLFNNSKQKEILKIKKLLNEHDVHKILQK